MRVKPKSKPITSMSGVKIKKIQNAGVPKKKRLRKKKEWKKCRDCNRWVHRWEGGSNVHFTSSKIACHECSIKYIEAMYS